MKVAIVHYWFVNYRGGEKFIDVLLEMFPDADIYTHVYSPKFMSDTIKSKKIYTSYIQKLPFAEKLYQLYMPLMPNALLDFNLQDYDLIISSESGPAKGVVPNPNAFHICYCHSPMRYIWDLYHEYYDRANAFVRFFMKRFTPRLRIWDVVSANLVDHFMANSTFVANRIRRYYKREPTLVYPIVEVEKFLTVERKTEDFYLFFGHLTGYKRADLAIEACMTSGRKLVIAGDGASKSIKKYKKTGLISFRGRVSDEEIKQLYSSARALIFPGIEDFGLIPVEAQAAGCPVIAYRGGGALDTVIENVTGLFFNEQTTASIIEALNRFEAAPENAFKDRERFAGHVQQFTKEKFKNLISLIISENKRN